MQKQEIVNLLHYIKIFPLFRNVALKIHCYSVTDDLLLCGVGEVLLRQVQQNYRLYFIFLDTRSRFLQPDICRCGNEDRQHLLIRWSQSTPFSFM